MIREGEGVAVGTNSYIEKCKRAVDKIVAEEFDSIQKFIDQELQPKTWDELQKMAFEASLKAVKKLEKQAGLG